MSIEVTSLAIPDLKLVEPKRFEDERGFFSETFNHEVLAAKGIDFQFVQDNHSLSRKQGTVRGLHFQRPPCAQAKLIRVVRGSILDVAVDLREQSPHYGRHVAMELSSKNWRQMFIPEGFAHGFCTLEPDTEVVYKVTTFYAPQSDAGIFWNDPALAIAWPSFAGAEISPKDTALPAFADFRSPFTAMIGQ
ncbi:MAG TPA: dTDP-4-dehydrorhamnose 3,5-epimerase [Rhizomicrobium sp.]|nr:dTDP-4-dehydrorhamnose 3,5-epimerase [Rhizomicrobium sp.]